MSANRLTINWQCFAAALTQKRRLWDDSLRDWAAQTGLSLATLSRAGSAREISAENYLTLCHFIGADPMEFAEEFHGKQSSQGPEYKGEAA